MPSSWITGEAAGTPQLAEILVCPIFIRALARSLQLSYREELRQPLMHGLLRPLGYRGDMSNTISHHKLSFWAAASAQRALAAAVRARPPAGRARPSPLHIKKALASKWYKARSACAWPKNVGLRFGNRQAVFHMKHSEYEGVAHAGNEAAAACLQGLPGLAHHRGHDQDSVKYLAIPLREASSEASSCAR
jgi:hypothetical protein